MFLCYKPFVLGWVTPSSTMTVAVYGHYGILTGTALLIGDSRKARPRFTTNNTSASCALHSIPVLFHPNSLRSVWRNDGSALVGHEFTGSRFSWGTPHKALPLTTPGHREAPLFITCSPAHTAATPYRSTTATPLLPRRCSIAAPFSFPQRHDFTSFGLGYHELLMDLLNSIGCICDYLPNPLASQLTFVWGLLVSLTTCLKIIGGVTGIFTEADLHTTLYLFYAKKALLHHLPADSLGPTVLYTASFLRSVSLPNVK
ncbi:Uncharacterized protein Rs2_04841 [Raphanus sativus]|nr:Uncharacterized protein Rs2_04841 [Raphanus sativus]